MFKNKIYALSIVSGILIGSLGIIPINADSELSESHDENNQTDVIQSDEIDSKTGFSDVSEDDWFYPYVNYLSEKNVVKGITETEFSPSGTFTVAESAAIITRYLGLEEDAQERKSAMELLGVPGCEKWYAGYIQLMHEAGIIDLSKYGCTVFDKHVSIDSYELLEAPVKRYEFCAFVIRSFELDGTEIRTGEDNTGLGHEFITGGSYDESVLEEYISHISDYSEIPDEYNYYVLKAYYNGIFNGDNLGKFNPENNLSRAEMAKVTAVIIDFSLRTYINITKPEKEQYYFGDYDFVEIDGKKYLKTIISDMMLQNEASSVSAFYENEQLFVTYNALKDAPEGYRISYVHYTKDKTGFDIDITDTAPDTEGFTYKNTYSVGDRFILILSDVSTGEAIDAYEFTLLAAGLVRENDCTYYS